jgi:hypothetical protein
MFSTFPFSLNTISCVLKTSGLISASEISWALELSSTLEIISASEISWALELSSALELSWAI